MGWAPFACAALRRGETVHLRPRGHSLTGKLAAGDRVTVAPYDPAALEGRRRRVGAHAWHQVLHLVTATQGDRFVIGNNRGGINGWVGRNAIDGKAVAVAPAYDDRWRWPSRPFMAGARRRAACRPAEMLTAGGAIEG
jgi:hypothetical protein